MEEFSDEILISIAHFLLQLAKNPYPQLIYDQGGANKILEALKIPSPSKKKEANQIPKIFGWLMISDETHGLII